MSYRQRLPQLSGKTFITDGGMETTLVFKRGFDLPCFASFVLLDSDDGVAAMRTYFAPYIEVAHDHGVGIILDTPTWRANPDWGDRLGYSADALDSINRRGVAFVEEIRLASQTFDTPIVISGCIGPRGDGYRPTELMTPAEAQDYHSRQVQAFSHTSADMISALTIPYVEEAIGIVRAGVEAGMPVVISFTVETDGGLPSGQSLRDAIRQVDAETAKATAYFMINCAHPTHFVHALNEEGPWLDRIGGLRANASTKTHAELDESTELDDGDPADLAARYVALKGRLHAVTVVGGCCGTDERHIEAICQSWLAPPALRATSP